MPGIVRRVNAIVASYGWNTANPAVLALEVVRRSIREEQRKLSTTAALPCALKTAAATGDGMG